MDRDETMVCSSNERMLSEEEIDQNSEQPRARLRNQSGGRLDQPKVSKKLKWGSKYVW